MPGYFFAAARKPAAALLQVDRVRVAVDRRDHAHAFQQAGQFLEGAFAALEVVDAERHQTRAAWRIAGKRHDRDTLPDRLSMVSASLLASEQLTMMPSAPLSRSVR